MANNTTDHDTIRKWVEDRGGVPATVESTADDSESAGLLRIDFPHGSRNDRLSTIPWEMFFEKFDSEKLSFLYEDKAANDELSRFCRFVRRDE